MTMTIRDEYCAPVSFCWISHHSRTLFLLQREKSLWCWWGWWSCSALLSWWSWWLWLVCSMMGGSIDILSHYVRWLAVLCSINVKTQFIISAHQYYQHYQHHQHHYHQHHFHSHQQEQKHQNITFQDKVKWWAKWTDIKESGSSQSDNRGRVKIAWCASWGLAIGEGGRREVTERRCWCLRSTTTPPAITW